MKSLRQPILARFFDRLTRFVERGGRAPAPKVLAQLRTHAAGTRVVIIQSRREAHRALAAIPDQRAARPPTPTSVTAA